MLHGGSLRTFTDFDHLVRDEAMRFPVYCNGCFLAWGVNEAEDFAGAFNGLSRQSLDTMMNIHVEWHRHFSFRLVLIYDESVTSQWL
jgi:hypothetical protein